jgi:tRNA(fMet)-specific endonuclease VapC
MEAFLARMRVLAWGSAEAQAYGEVRACLEAAGRTLGNIDMMIAAHAVAANAILVTSDKAFSRVDRLSQTVNWAADL